MFGISRDGKSAPYPSPLRVRRAGGLGRTPADYCFDPRVDAWAAALESMDDDGRRASLAYVAGQQVEIPESELNEALRRALVVRAVGGSPQRELRLEEEAVLRLADELDYPDRREALRTGLEALRVHVRTRPAAEAALDSLLADDDVAWLCFAAAHLAAELSS
jgi:hypothetical protein